MRQNNCSKKWTSIRLQESWNHIYVNFPRPYLRTFYIQNFLIFTINTVILTKRHVLMTCNVHLPNCRNRIANQSTSYWTIWLGVSNSNQHSVTPTILIPFCFHTFHRVHQQEAENKMSLHNLAMVFGPTLLSRPGPHTGKHKDGLESSTVDVMAQAGILYCFLSAKK